MWAVWLLALGGGLLALLAVPADVSLEMERVQTLKLKLGFRWLFIRVRHELDPAGPRRQSESKPRTRGAPPSFRTLVAVGRVPGLWAAARRFLRRLAASVSVLQVAGRVRLGAGDPADTGRLWGLAAPGVFWLNRSPRVQVSLEPDFASAGLTGTLGGTLRLYPARLAYALASAVFSITTVRLLLAISRSRRGAVR